MCAKNCRERCSKFGQVWATELERGMPMLAKDPQAPMSKRPGYGNRLWSVKSSTLKVDEPVSGMPRKNNARTNGTSTGRSKVEANTCRKKRQNQQAYRLNVNIRFGFVRWWATTSTITSGPGPGDSHHFTRRIGLFRWG